LFSSKEETNMIIKETNIKKTMAWISEQTIPTERPQFVGDVSANFRG
jgi:hypothetical protein